MVGEVLAGAGALKNAFDMAKGLVNLGSASAVNSASIGLQEKIMEAQAAQFTLAEEVRELKEKLASFETWESEKKRYQLYDFGRGIFLYAIKEEERGAEPLHAICSSCYTKRIKSVLSSNGSRTWPTHALRCASCGTEHAFPFSNVPDAFGRAVNGTGDPNE